MSDRQPEVVEFEEEFDIGPDVVVEVEDLNPGTEPNRDELVAGCKGLESQHAILPKLDKELKKNGFAGSTEVPQFVFLCMYTRFFERPVSLLIKGPSGSGKSFALAAALKFVPDEAYELYHGMSEKALIYNPDLDLQHRYLIIQEAAGLNKGDGRVFIRQLLSEGKVRYATVQSTQDGLIGKDLPTVQGPAGLMMTTTANALHPEDESRMLSVHIDESRERTKAILVVQALGSSKSGYKPDYSKWHALHRYVAFGKCEVEIPFALQLAESLPVDHFRIDRDFPQLLSLIKAHALLHQCNRERAKSGAVIATIRDYAEVFRLVAEPLAQGLEVAVSDNIREVVEAVRDLIGELKRERGSAVYPVVSQRLVAEKLKRDRSVVSRNVAVAIKAGYLANETPGQGREATLRLGERELPKGSVLPTPEELQDDVELMELLSS